MAYLRSYMAVARGGVLPGRGQMRGDPFFGMAVAGLAGRLIKKGVAKLLPKSKLIAQARRAVAGPFAPFMPPGTFGSVPSRRQPFGGGGGFGGGGAGGSFGRRRYRRMNAGNAKALRRAFRRIDAFTKLAQKAGYVRHKPFGRRTKK